MNRKLLIILVFLGVILIAVGVIIWLLFKWYIGFPLCVIGVIVVFTLLAYSVEGKIIEKRIEEISETIEDSQEYPKPNNVV
jgi:hypothetical protein